jgi:hypothetical protein
MKNFSGAISERPEEWMFQFKPCHRRLSDECKKDMFCSLLRGEALTWFYRLHLDNRVPPSFDELEELFRFRFIIRRSTLCEMQSLDTNAYISQFYSISSSLCLSDQKVLIQLFINGVIPELRRFLIGGNFQSLYEVQECLREISLTFESNYLPFSTLSSIPHAQNTFCTFSPPNFQPVENEIVAFQATTASKDTVFGSSVPVPAQMPKSRSQSANSDAFTVMFSPLDFRNIPSCSSAPVSHMPSQEKRDEMDSNALFQSSMITAVNFQVQASPCSDFAQLSPLEFSKSISTVLPFVNSHVPDDPVEKNSSIISLLATNNHAPLFDNSQANSQVDSSFASSQDPLHIILDSCNVMSVDDSCINPDCTVLISVNSLPDDPTVNAHQSPVLPVNSSNHMQNSLQITENLPSTPSPVALDLSIVLSNVSAESYSVSSSPVASVLLDSTSSVMSASSSSSIPDVFSSFPDASLDSTCSVTPSFTPYDDASIFDANLRPVSSVISSETMPCSCLISENIPSAPSSVLSDSLASLPSKPASNPATVSSVFPSIPVFPVLPTCFACFPFYCIFK